MNPLKSMLLILLFALPLSLLAQNNQRTISKMQAGTKLNKDDIGFLHMVSKAQLPTSRGDMKIEASLAGKKYTEGYTLTQEDATSINGAIDAFQKDNKGTKKPKKSTAESRGAGLCYYDYYWCNAYGYCRWYRHWYYC